VKNIAVLTYTEGMRDDISAESVFFI
jgi:hypothetical protein